MKKIVIVGRVLSNPECTADEDDHVSFAHKLVHVMTPIATAVTALATFVTCASAMNTVAVTVLAVAWVLAGWLARGRRCHCRTDRRHVLLSHAAEGSA
ncbi:hypothetical protein DFR70_110122 [Nocardia tenerifensis]|uniref:Uncharacterized protein n=1 Tax=Nocardia tenerifensis TaxID=228006 RepID=A0A318JZ75_9NOCA|nr:hypothetical protein [Nocardia tenerifensis]PXX60282.1 hypothetical protein DFR70_110122 [Nocardia tenerifensis]